MMQLRAALARRGLRRAGDVLLVLLTIAAVVAVVGTMREAPKPPDQLSVAAVAPKRASIGASGDVVLRWIGSACPAADAGTFTRSTDRGVTWSEVAVPLATVERISVNGRIGLAIGRDDRCQLAFAVTQDTGVSWRPVALPAGTLTADVVGGGGTWSIVGGDVRRGALGRARPVTNGCLSHAEAPRAALVEAYGPDNAWLVCQQADGRGRTLLSTVDGARTWQTVSTLGADAVGAVGAMDFLDADTGWALLRGGACGPGELRVTNDAGVTWESLPCVSASMPSVTTLLAVTFADPTTVLAVAVANDAAVGLLSDDGGRTWARTG